MLALVIVLLVAISLLAIDNVRLRMADKKPQNNESGNVQGDDWGRPQYIAPGRPSPAAPSSTPPQQTQSSGNEPK
jgi:hypothetical protein